jgi:hypothetical protein
MSDEQRVQTNQAVFGAAGGPQPILPAGMKTQTVAEQAKEDFGIDIPLESVPLPSLGKVYPPASPLHGKSTVDIRAMTSREEDILSSRAFLKKGTVITELIKSCLVNKGIDPVELLNGDRNALMVAIRITGYGAEYPADVTCNKGDCDHTATQTFNLGQLPIRQLQINPVAAGMNLFEFLLPVTKKTVRFKFLTGRDEEQIMQTSAAQKKLNLVVTDQVVTTNLLYTIQSVDGIDDRAKIAGFVKVMPARDSLALRNYIRDNEPGIIMKQTVTCPACEESDEVNMPISTGFLWPGAGR